jgi:hypothetical protein
VFSHAHHASHSHGVVSFSQQISGVLAAGSGVEDAADEDLLAELRALQTELDGAAQAVAPTLSVCARLSESAYLPEPVCASVHASSLSVFFLLISSSTFRPCCARRLAVQLAQRRQRRQRRPVRPTLRTCVLWSHGCRLPPPAPSLAPRLPRIPLTVLLQVVAPVESPCRASWPRAGILFWKFISVRTSS